MNAIVAEWIEKAEGDWVVAMREWRARKLPNYDAACFHAQQCAEKYLKARLRKNGVNPPKIHDLLALLDSVAELEPNWEVFRPDLALLTVYSVNSGIQAIPRPKMKPAYAFSHFSDSEKMHEQHLSWTETAFLSLV